MGMDFYPGRVASVGASAIEHSVVAPSDTVNLPYIARGIYVGTGGHVSLVSVQGTACLYKNVAAGTMLDVQAMRVNLSGTTAADMVALY